MVGVYLEATPIPKGEFPGISQVLGSPKALRGFRITMGGICGGSAPSPLGIPVGSAKDQESTSIPVLSLFLISPLGKIPFSLNILLNMLGHSDPELIPAGYIRGAGIRTNILDFRSEKSAPFLLVALWNSEGIHVVIPTWTMQKWERHP